MAHPKRRHSTSRRDKRRTHDLAPTPTLWRCSSTKEIHLPHHTYEHDDKVYYRGRIFMEKKTK